MFCILNFLVLIVILQDLGQHLKNLNEYEDKMLRKNLQPDPNVRM